jgi:hypothetical protein
MSKKSIIVALNLICHSTNKLNTGDWVGNMRTACSYCYLSYAILWSIFFVASSCSLNLPIVKMFLGNQPYQSGKLLLLVTLPADDCPWRWGLSDVYVWIMNEWILYWRVLGCYAMWYGRYLLTFQRDVLLPSSGWKIEPSKEQAACFLSFNPEGGGSTTLW